jgi:hypothetical protein
MHLKDDPMYAKYFKMLKFGLPMGACKLKMEADGVDSSVCTMLLLITLVFFLFYAPRVARYYVAVLCDSMLFFFCPLSDS